MIAITILLGVIAASGVFSQLDPYGASEPQVDAAYFYSEDRDPATEDSFGVQGKTNLDGMVQIDIESITEEFSADQLTLRINGIEYNWANNETEYSGSDIIRTGDSITVWADRGDEVLLTWETADGEESFIISSYNIPEFGTVSLLPDADEDCSWVENQLAPGPPYSGDLTIDGIIVECDLDQYDIGNIDILNGGGVIGEVEGTGNINIDDGSTWDGDVRSTSGGDVDVTSQSEINGNIDTTGNVNIDDTSEVEGFIRAVGNIQINNDSIVEGDIESTNSGDITVLDTSTVLGALATQGGVDVDSGTVQQEVYLDGSFNCDNGATINGQSCASYTPEDYGDY
jgi:cytoskeletal protein CcmA (bactofilin family)